MLINQANLANLYTGFKATFQKAFEGVQPMYEKVATTVPSTTRSENYAWMGSFTRMREWIGDRVVKNLSNFTYTITNKDWEATVSVPRNDIEDDSYGVYSPVMSEMGLSARTHPDELVFGLLADGFDSPCYDGQYFFDSDHPVANGTVSNLQSGSGSPWFLLDCSRAIKPIIFQLRKAAKFQALVKDDDANVFWKKEYIYGCDSRYNVGFGLWQMAFGSKATLDQTNFDLAIAAMMSTKNDEGRPLGVKPTLLVVGPSLRDKANAVVLSQKLANGADNPNYKVVDVLVCPWL